MKERFLIYLSGSYRGTRKWYFDMATLLWNKGFAVYCPHLNCWEFEKAQIKESEMVEGNLEILSKCDYLLLFDGWNGSTSAILEKKKADSLSIPIFESLNDLQYEIDSLSRIDGDG